MIFPTNQNTPQHDLTEAERLAWLRLYRTENVGTVTFYQLIETFGNATDALKALPELSRRGGRKNPLSPANEGDVLKEYKALTKRGGKILTPLDREYPLALAATDAPPPILSALGNTALLNKSCIAIVGARNASLNGRKFALALAHDLGQRGQIIVSGLARGIDTAAHQGALESGTIAVVAGGIDVVYPEENQKLYDEICEKGLVIAESKWGQQPFAQSFPRRNRIVSGLSKGVIVVEATLRSGSLITARLAGEQGRDVYAVPGSPLDPRCTGPNHLIREGATLIRGAEDVMEQIMDFSGNGFREPPANIIPFAPQHIGAQNRTEESSTEKIQEDILSHLSFSPINVDELVRACHVTISVLQSVLLELELAGRVKRLPGNRISLVDQGLDE